jgi:NAD(P)-dependent dehydrogenase (short-subunit alcohol dehydrogenase family)
VADQALSGKRCFITGAASGIGRATALAAARDGAELYLTDIDAPGLERIVAEVEGVGGRVGRAQAIDIRDHDAVVALAAEIDAAHGSMDVVMNIAGVSTWGSIEQLQHSDWQQMVDVNLVGPISVLECFVPAMIAAGRGGHVVNVSSAAGLLGLPWHAAYSASKFGLRGVSEVLRFDLRRHGIGVSLVCPGGVRTPLVGTVKIVGVDAENPRIRKLKARFERRAVSPEHVAEKILQGIAKDRYLVFTSADIRVGYWAQRLCPPLYELAMRKMNDVLVRTAQGS